MQAEKDGLSSTAMSATMANPSPGDGPSHSFAVRDAWTRVDNFFRKHLKPELATYVPPSFRFTSSIQLMTT